MTPQGYTVTAAENGMPLVSFLASRLRASRNQAKRLLDQRLVFVGSRRVWMARHALRPGDRVEVHTPAPARRVQVLYQDDDVVVADKPAGALSNGPSSLETDLRSALACPTLRAAHRLDRDTSGCILYAKTPAALEGLVAAFRTKSVRKVYRALVLGRVPPGTREVAAPLEGRTAVTRLRVLDSNRLASHLAVSLLTGRTHQIRKHMASIGHPVVGDRVYATGDQPVPLLRGTPRQMLHAAEIVFPHPRTGAAVRVRAALPRDFALLLEQIGLR